LIVDFARKLVQKGSLRSKNNPTQIATFVYSYFEEEFEFDYTVDREQFGKIEYWEQADKTLETREGDCDDLALVMHLVLREVLRQTGFGDHVWRIRFTASRTLSGGHAYNIWLGEDLEWYVMESTMDQEGSFHRTWLETPLRHNNFYHSFYGFATPEQTWRGDLDSVQPADDDIKRP